MTDRVTVTVHYGVADVRLNRPDKLNALDLAMFEALVDAGDALAADAVRAGRGAVRRGPRLLRRPGLRRLPGDGRRRHRAAGGAGSGG